MSNIYLNTEQQSMPPTDNQIEGCHGHYVSINAGGKGHSYGDSCGCDGINPETNIDFIAPLLILSAFIIIIKRKNKVFTRRWVYKLFGKYFFITVFGFAMVVFVRKVFSKPLLQNQCYKLVASN